MSTLAPKIRSLDIITTTTPKLFISYSHDNQPHKDWVLTLTTRLVKNGVDVILDQWNLALGADLPHFMEQGLSKSDRILAVCTESYVKKANNGQAGTGYEKMILTGQLMKDTTSNRIIPIIRSSTDKLPLVPTFLSSSTYIDFRNNLEFEIKYGELIRDIYGKSVKPRPPLGPNPFTIELPELAPLISFGPERYVSPALSGNISFDYSNNNGRFVFGGGDMAFETAWSRASLSDIYAYNDPPSIRTLALALNAKNINKITNASIYDTSSRARKPYLGEIVMWKNTAGYYLATKIVAITVRDSHGGADTLTLEYKTVPNKSNSFKE